MPIIDLQRKAREVGRIRIGQKVPTSGGKSRPAKLDRFRLTSQDEAAIRAAAGIYGGSPQLWADAPVGEQWEVFTEAQVLPVRVPPTQMAFTQWNETWSGGGCTRRCDGQTEMISGDPCLCSAADEMTCKPTSRLSVFLEELPGIGVWRLESHGWYAATELAGSVELIDAVANGRTLVPAWLRLEQRQVKRIKPGGGAETRNFAVPALDPRETLRELGAANGQRAALEASTMAQLPPAAPAGPGFTPVDTAALAPAPVAPVAEQLANPGRQRRTTSRSAEPIPRTGVKPRQRGAQPAPEAPPEEPPPPPDEEDTPGAPSLRPEQHLAMACRDAGITDDADRHALYAAVVGVDSGKAMNARQIRTVEEVLDRIKAKRATLADYLTSTTKESDVGQALQERLAALGEDGRAEMLTWWNSQDLIWPLTPAELGAMRATLDVVAAKTAAA